MANGAWAEFKGDLRASLKAWGVAPLLPVISVLLFLTGHIPQAWWWAAAPVFLFTIGWFGTERIWYLRIYRGQTIGAADLWRATRAFFWRFLRLGLLAVLVWVPVVFIAMGKADDPEQFDRVFSEPLIWVTAAILTIAVDFSLTFVTPALAYSTNRVGEALTLGFRMLREEWPRPIWYAVVPPLAVVVMLRVTEPAGIGIVEQMSLTAASTLLNLWFKGATAAFYLRRVEVGENDGAVPVGGGEQPAAGD